MIKYNASDENNVERRRKFFDNFSIKKDIFEKILELLNEEYKTGHLRWKFIKIIYSDGLLIMFSFLRGSAVNYSQ